MAARNTIAIDVGRRRVRALCARRNGRRLYVQRVLVDTIPDNVDADDAQAIGKWIGAILREANFPRTAATVAISRERVVLKRMSLPTISDDELPDMARLALRRDLPFDADEAVIDFITTGRTENSTAILAVAVSRSVISFAETMASAAGLSVERVSLRSMGTAALLSTYAERDDRGMLAIDITGDAIEFNVVVDGVIRFSRGAELTYGDAPAKVSETIATETRRTWMSYRIVADSNDVAGAIVLGDRTVGADASIPIREMLNVPTEVFDEHPLVQRGGHEMETAWPLAGLLLESTLGGQTIDFANPRKAPDIAARRRQRIIAAAGILVVALLGAWTVGNVKLKRLQAEFDTLETKADGDVSRARRFKRDMLKLSHLEEWGTVGVDWLDHVAHLDQVAPPTDELVLDSWLGAMDFRGVQYDKDRTWSAPCQIKIVIEGEAQDRLTADAFRAALVNGDQYTLHSAGPDAGGGRRLPFSLNYRLASTDSSPLRDEIDEANAPDDQGAIVDVDADAADSSTAQITEFASREKRP